MQGVERTTAKKNRFSQSSLLQHEWVWSEVKRRTTEHSELNIIIILYLQKLSSLWCVFFFTAATTNKYIHAHTHTYSLKCDTAYMANITVEECGGGDMFCWALIHAVHLLIWKSGFYRLHYYAWLGWFAPIYRKYIYVCTLYWKWNRRTLHHLHCLACVCVLERDCVVLFWWCDSFYLFNVVLFEGLSGTIDGILLHFFAHVSIFNHSFAVWHFASWWRWRPGRKLN